MKDHKTALVTGSNRGIGLAVVKQLAQEGFTVILTSRKPEDGKKVLLSMPENVYYHQLDITNNQSVNAIKDYVEKEFGRLDILVNNAGINYDTWQNTLNADLENVQDTINTNLIGPWRMALAFIPLMQKHNYGRIVNVSSGAGALEGMKGGTPGYGISKAALNALTLKLADELSRHDILVNSVCPGWVRTDMGGSEAPRSLEKGAETIVWAALLPSGGPSGKFFRDKKEIPF